MKFRFYTVDEDSGGGIIISTLTAEQIAKECIGEEYLSVGEFDTQQLEAETEEVIEWQFGIVDGEKWGKWPHSS